GREMDVGGVRRLERLPDRLPSRREHRHLVPGRLRVEVQELQVRKENGAHYLAVPVLLLPRADV
ncbi:hypothetical protein C8T65DRAFT_669785, partial [Cerioporus squamosus]